MGTFLYEYFSIWVLLHMGTSLYGYLSIWVLLYKGTSLYYMEESVLLGTKPLVDSIHHFIRDPIDVFSVCHLCECRIVQ